tara:strand:- start:6228 stop:6671 length:444 start_codon:yes stop_codon:yes gene_type:complete
MPLCPRCGKTLSSEQAVTYHLNKKYKCGSWKCHICNKTLATKFDLNIHLLSKCNEYNANEIETVPSSKRPQSNNVLVVEYNNLETVANMSKNSNELIGYDLNDLCGQKFINHKNEDGKIVYQHGVTGNDIKFNRIFSNEFVTVDIQI